MIIWRLGYRCFVQVRTARSIEALSYQKHTDLSKLSLGVDSLSLPLQVLKFSKGTLKRQAITSSRLLYDWLITVNLISLIWHIDWFTASSLIITPHVHSLVELHDNHTHVAGLFKQIDLKLLLLLRYMKQYPACGLASSDK